MGYESHVSGSAKGKNLVEQLLDRGFQKDGQYIDSPTGWFTGAVVVDGDTIAGSAEWHTCYGFDELIAALQQGDGLEVVDFRCIGEDHNDEEAHLYIDGCWYTRITIRHLVRADRVQEAGRAVEAALAPFAPPSPVSDIA
jgi:hypothetical protein